MKRILTICLVLLIVVLGSVAYRGYSRQSELEKESAGYQAKYEQVCAGADRRMLLATRAQDELLADCKTQLAAAHQSRLAADEQGRDARKERAHEVAVYECRIEDYERRLKEKETARAALEEQLTDVQAGIDRALADFKADPDNVTSLKKIAQLEADRAKLSSELRKAHADMELKVHKLEERIPQIDLLSYEQPKGKIVKVDGAQQTVYLSLGSADLVKPGLTFSVFGEAEYKPNVERKASVEVVEVSDEHQCRARVTEIRNAARRPIIPGDQLYNPMWTPGLRDHVAVAGAIDLSGDGRDGTAEFVKAVEKEGAIVDVWLDVKELSLKGAIKAINAKTTYLILGDIPELDGIANDPRYARTMALHRAIHDLREEAMRHGVSIVNARRYMALAGMKAPKPGSKSNEK